VSKAAKLTTIAILVDSISIIFGIYAAYFVRFVSRNETLGRFLFFEGVSILLFILVSWIVFLNLSNLYQNSTITSIKNRQILFMKYSIFFIALIGLASFISKSNLSRLLVLYLFIISIILNLIFRILTGYALVRNFRWRDSLLMRGLAISKSKDEIRSALDWLDSKDNIALSYPKFMNCDSISLDWLEEFERLRSLFPIDYVIISPSLLQDNRIGELVNYLHDLKLEVFMIPLASKATGFWLNPRESESSPFLQFDNGKKQTIKLIIKRVFDVAFAVTITLLALPLFLLVSFIILYFDGKPIFYVSKRVGRNGDTFAMLKFRTMYKNSEHLKRVAKNVRDGSEFIFKDANDPRVTQVGKYLRKYSLDELPQFLNVLRGDMSVVGPRPFPPHEVTRFDSLYLRRLGCKPGVTGPWQVKGRSDLNLYDSKGLDLEYANNWSLTGDLLLIAKTIPAVLKKSGAY